MTMRRKKNSEYDESTIQMLDNIKFACEDECPSLARKKDGDSDDYCVNSLPRALNVSLERKYTKIKRFLERHSDSELTAHMSQLYGFAQSTNGLMKDEFRERIWPVLAENIPKADRIKLDNGENSRQSCCTSLSDEDFYLNGNNDDYSDSDFESAVSTFSTTTSLESNNGKLRRKRKKVYDEVSVYDVDEIIEPSIEQLKSHRDWNQVEMDVNRTLARFPPNITDMERDTLQHDLTPLIVQVMSSNPNFRYYQGFHDICLTLLLVMDSDKALRAAKSLTRRSSFYNYLSYSLEETALTELQNIYVLLYLHDSVLEQKMRLADLGVMFALSWPLTWFSHDLQSYSQIVVFFDLFLSSHFLMPIYVSAAIIIERREEVLDPQNVDMPIIHHLLNHIPPTLNIDRVLETAKTLFSRFPPSLVRGEYRKEYERMCLRQRRQRIAVAKLKERIPKAGTIPRNNALLAPWVVAGTAAGAVAIYLWVSRSYLSQNGLF